MRINNKPYLVYPADVRGVPKRIRSCDRCIGACCMLTRINALSLEELKFIASVTFTIDVLGQISLMTERDLEALHIYDFPNLSLSHYLNGLLAINRLLEKDPSKRSCSISPATACGYLTEKGLCSVYQRRVRTCCDFKPGCEACKKIYIAKGSLAGIAYAEALNAGEKVLGMVDPYYNSRVFDFSR